MIKKTTPLFPFFFFLEARRRRPPPPLLLSAAARVLTAASVASAASARDASSCLAFLPFPSTSLADAAARAPASTAARRATLTSSRGRRGGAPRGQRLLVRLPGRPARALRDGRRLSQRRGGRPLARKRQRGLGRVTRDAPPRRGRRGCETERGLIVVSRCAFSSFFDTEKERERALAGESGGVVFVLCLWRGGRRVGRTERERERESDEDEEEKKEKTHFFLFLHLHPSFFRNQLTSAAPPIPSSAALWSLGIALLS